MPIGAGDVYSSGLPTQYDPDGNPIPLTAYLPNQTSNPLSIGVQDTSAVSVINGAVLDMRGTLFSMFGGAARMIAPDIDMAGCNSVRLLCDTVLRMEEWSRLVVQGAAEFLKPPRTNPLDTPFQNVVLNPSLTGLMLALHSEDRLRVSLIGITMCHPAIVCWQGARNNLTENYVIANESGQNQWAYLQFAGV